MRYRADIDGLRAIAVLGVVLYHAGLGISGGFIGVDVFFVISGFLITSIINKDIKSGQFSMLQFWERRARRILPALFVVVLFTLVLGYFICFPDDYHELVSSVISLAVFSSNIYFLRNTSGYFDGPTESVPLLHTWSLSVEEQFYVLIPLLLWLLARNRRSHWNVSIIAVIASVSLMVSIYGVRSFQSATFYLLPTRAWELAFGSLVAFAKPVESFRWRTFISWMGLGLIIVPMLFYTAEIEFPGLSALPPVLGASMLIWVGICHQGIACRQVFIQRLISNRIFVGIGLMSYSLYLWHWPLFAFSKYIGDFDENRLVRVLILTLSFILAWVSLRFVERPFRSREIIRSRRMIFSMAIGAAILIVIPSLFIRLNGGVPSRFSDELQAQIKQLKADDRKKADDRGQKSVKFHATGSKLERADFADGHLALGILGERDADPVVFVWGDSHAQRIATVVDAICRENSVGGRLTKQVVPVMNWVQGNGVAEDYNAAVFEYLSKENTQEYIRDVILVGRWWARLSGDANGDPKTFRAALASSVERLLGMGYSVSILRQAPQWHDVRRTPRRFPFHFVAHSLKWEYDELIMDEKKLKERFGLQNSMFEDMQREFPQVRFIDPLPILKSTGNVFRYRDSKRALYTDGDHLSAHGTMQLRELFGFLVE